MAYCGPRGIALADFLRWSRDSQNAALEWQARESRRCRGCGTHPDDWAEDQHAHHAHLSDQCPGCLRAASVERHFTDNGKKPLDPGVTVLLPHGPAKDCPRCNPS
jgi:hypothetical protein